MNGMMGEVVYMARILIADDAMIMRRNIGLILEKAGHEIVAEASNGDEAYEGYGKYQPDLVTMDITMPVMDGLAAVKKIISSYPNAKIVVISAQGNKYSVMEAIMNGAASFIVKPIDSKKVINVVNKVLNIVEESPEEPIKE